MTPVHPRNGLSSLGRELVLELNRLGSESPKHIRLCDLLIDLVMVDLSHVSDEVMEEVRIQEGLLHLGN